MSKRQYSMMEYWDKVTSDIHPKLSFNGETPADFAKWLPEAYAKYVELLGDFPAHVPLDAEIEYTVFQGEQLIRERVVFDTEEWMSVPCYVLRRKDMKQDKTNAAIICVHGHGEFGKETLCGLRPLLRADKSVPLINNYAERMAWEGYLTIALDMRGFGERKEPYDPIKNIARDPCNVQFLKGGILGRYPMMSNLWDLKCCVDYLQTRSEIDPERIGIMGVSTGATYSVFAAALDKRIKAADCSGYLNPWRKYGIERGMNFCGWQFTPNMWTWLDAFDIAGMIADHGALLLEMGIYDYSFPIEDLLLGHQGTKRIFEAAGVGEHLVADINPDKHAFAGKKAFPFFDHFLRGADVGDLLK